MAVGYQSNRNSVEDYIRGVVGINGQEEQPEDIIGGEQIAPVAPASNMGFESPEQDVVRADPASNINNMASGKDKAMARRSQPSQDNSQPSQQDTAGKTQEQVMAESGQQSQLDQMQSQPSPQPVAQPQQQMQPEPQMQAPVQPVQDKPVQQQLAEAGQQEVLDQAGQAGVDVSQPVEVAPAQPTPQPQQAEVPIRKADQPGVFGGEVQVTAKANQPYLNGRINRGTDFAGESGTPVALPEGNWEVVQARNDVNQRRPEDFSEKQNFGWGNSVKVKNQKTGELMQMSHMKEGTVPDLQPGQVLEGGTVVGGIGNTGNTHGKTGNHLDVEYYDGQGKRQDVLNSPYGSYFGN